MHAQDVPVPTAPANELDVKLLTGTTVTDNKHLAGTSCLYGLPVAGRLAFALCHPIVYRNFGVVEVSTGPI